MRASSDFCSASAIVFSRFSSMPSNMGQPNFHKTMTSTMKAMSIGTVSTMSGKMSATPVFSFANASAGKANEALAAAPVMASHAFALFALLFTR